MSNETVELSTLDSLTVADALVDQWIRTSDDSKRARIVHALHALGYPETVASLETLESHSVRV